MRSYIYSGLLAALLISCNEKPAVRQPELLNASAFEQTVDNKEVKLYTLQSNTGMVAQVTNFGGRIVSLWVPDKDGNFDDVVLGHADLGGYIEMNGERFLGCVVGRYANRLANGQFTLDGTTDQVLVNNNGQSLHGGEKGFDMVVWNVDNVTPNSLSLSYVSADGEQGYPGTLTVKMVYTITDQHELKITYEAETDKPTVVNLSNHSFFNLKGEGQGTILDHYLHLNASHITPVTDVLIPTGEIAYVGGTPFDFREAMLIGDRINEDNEQLKNGLGYDHNWILDRSGEKGVELAATVYEPTTGRFMEVYTDQPAIQFYAGNFFDGTGKGKYGKTHNYREAIALETQKYPDSPNHDNFPSTRLDPGQTYEQTCIYKFSTK